MATSLDQIKHHQRILITGSRKIEILEECQKVLNHYKKDSAYMDEKGELNGESPTMVFILSNGEATDFEPHIALFDEVPEAEYDNYLSLADSIPKSGTLVYNTNNSNAKKICEMDRVDVHQEIYSGTKIEAARGLLRRIGINDQRFDAAIA